MRRRRRGPSPASYLAAGFLGGAVLGFALWSTQIRRSRRDLFSKRRIERAAALSYLGARPSVETARLLKDYLDWEPSPLLRRRGAVLLRRMERELL